MKNNISNNSLLYNYSKLNNFSENFENKNLTKEFKSKGALCLYILLFIFGIISIGLGLFAIILKKRLIFILLIFPFGFIFIIISFFLIYNIKIIIDIEKKIIIKKNISFISCCFPKYYKKIYEFEKIERFIHFQELSYEGLKNFKILLLFKNKEEKIFITYNKSLEEYSKILNDVIQNNN